MDENQAAFLPFSKKEYVGAGVLWQNESLYKIGLLEFIFVTPRNNKLRRFLFGYTNNNNIPVNLGNT